MSYPHYLPLFTIQSTQELINNVNLKPNINLISERESLLSEIGNKLRLSHILQYMIDLKDQSSIRIPGITAAHYSMFEETYLEAQLQIRECITRDNYMTSGSLLQLITSLYEIVYQGQISIIRSLSYDQLSHLNSLWRTINSPTGMRLPNGEKCKGYWLDIESSPNLF
jgi:hypothetical protein